MVGTAMFLSWIPLLGPILQGLFSTASSIYSKFKDTQVGMRQQEVAEEQVAAQVIHDTNDDIGVRILRDAYCTPAVVNVLFTGWDTLIAESPHVDHSWMWHVASYPDSYAWYLPSVAAFLVGTVGLNIWKRK